MRTSWLLLTCGLLAAGVAADFVGHNHNHNHDHRQGQRPRLGKQDSALAAAVQGGIDFSGCKEDAATGLCCVDKEETVTSLEKEPILECTHKNVEQCHFSYVTQFTPSQEQVCEENFEKSCQITFKQQAFNETVKKCYKPTQKVCNGQGEEICQTVYESSCTTKWVERAPGKFVEDTKCEKLPVEICGAGCTFEEGEEQCHDKVLTSLVDVPEEACDLNPQKTCRYVTKLVPKLKPENQCTIVPKETCSLKFTTPKQVPKPLLTRWCLDSTPVVPSQDSVEDEPQVQAEAESRPQPAESRPQPADQQPAYTPEPEAPRPLDTGYLSPGAVPRNGRTEDRFVGQLPARSGQLRRPGSQFGTPF